MKEIKVRSIASRSWDFTSNHWPLFLLLAFLQGIAESFGTTNNSSEIITQLSDGESLTPEMLQGIVSISPVWGPISFLLSCYISMVTYRYLKNAVLTNKTEPAEGQSVWRVTLTAFAFFAATLFLMAVCIAIGTVLLLIPGLILFIRLEFAPFIAATENVGVDDAFRKSWRLTKGHFWKLLLMNLSFIPITIVGLLCCCVGVIFSSIMIEFMTVVAYYDLTKEEVEEEVVVEETEEVNP